MNKPLLLILSFIFLIGRNFSQVRVGTWEDHVSFNYCSSVSELDGKIYASNYSSILVYDKTDKSIEKLNKSNFLSDVGILFMKKNDFNNRLLVIYESSNIDVISSSSEIHNFPDIFRKNYSGKKNINDVVFSGKYAYLSCGFGIALFDTEKLEIKDTYIIGPGGNNLEVLQLAITDSLFYAATPNGLLKCNYKLKLPNDYKSWVKAGTNLPNGYFGYVVNYNNSIIAGYSPYKQSYINNQDTLYQFVNNAWITFPYMGFPYYIKKMNVTNNKLGLITQFGSVFYNSSFVIDAYVTQYLNHNVNPKDLMCLGAEYWIADIDRGLIKTYGSNPYYAPEFIRINGTNKSQISNIDVFKGKVAVSPSHIDQGGGALYSHEGINVLSNNQWSYLRPEDLPADSIIDYCWVLIDRKDTSRIWASSWVNGMVEYRHNSIVTVYNGDITGAMQETLPGWWRTSGSAMDDNGNLWFGVSDVTKYLSVRRTDGVFQNFSFDGASRFVRKVYCDKSNQIWILHERDQGITITKFGKSGSSFVNQGYKILTKNEGSGNLGSNSVYSYCEDLDGKIWIGTATGLRVFNNPSEILNGGSIDGEPIKIVQDGNVELLLETEIVTCIDIDAGNNKWVGTFAGGVYCFTPDGQTQLYHFTTDNSPLYSNQIIDLRYSGETGDVYIGSDLGLQSYKNLIIDGKEDFKGIKAYPNPVKPNYTGNVYVSGLVDKSIVKIVDEAGNFVWETKAEGGRIEWSVKSFANNRVPSGVYLIYAAVPNGEMKVVTKILVIN